VSGPDSEGVERLKTAVYEYGCRRELAARLGEHDYTNGAEGAIEYLRTVADESRPIHAYWGDVLEAARALEKQVPLDGALW
jgi:hypothetical protein